MEKSVYVKESEWKISEYSAETYCPSCGNVVISKSPVKPFSKRVVCKNCNNEFIVRTRLFK